MFIRMKNKWTDEFEGSEIIKEVYQIYDEKKGDDIDLWAFTFEEFTYCITKDMIIDQANTIEELVDGYFVHDSHGYSAEFHRPNIAKITQGICYAFINVNEEPKLVAVWDKEKKEWELL